MSFVPRAFGAVRLRGVANGRSRDRRFALRIVLAIVSIVLLVDLRSGTALCAPLLEAPWYRYDAPGGPWAIAIGDLNGDGRPDLATANHDVSTISILIG